MRASWLKTTETYLKMICFAASMGFFTQCLKHPRITGAVAPSSRFLAEKMLKPIDFTSARTIVELGAGTGVFTRKILKLMRKDASLDVFEINPKFVKQLRSIKDARLAVHDIPAELLAKRVSKADAIISSLPLLALPAKQEHQILGVAKNSLKPGGLFVQFQYTPRGKKLLDEYFSEVSVDFTPLNIPPAFIYTCRN